MCSVIVAIRTKFNCMKYMNNRTRLYLVNLLSAVMVILLAVPAMAEDGPWKWQVTLNLTKDKKGNQMLLPTGLYIDKERERYYVVDAGTNSLYSFDSLGNHLNTLKPGDQLKQPYGMLRDANDQLWVVEKGRNSLTQIDLKEKKITPHNLLFGNREIFPDRMILHDGYFYILDRLTGHVVKFDNNLKLLQEICCTDGILGFVDITISNNNIFALEPIDKKVYVFNMNGEVLRKIDISASNSFPIALDIGPSDQIYVLDRHQGAVAVYDMDGGFKYKFLAKGQSRGRLYYPEDIQFDYLGRLCVVDSGNGRVEIFGR